MTTEIEKEKDRVHVRTMKKLLGMQIFIIGKDGNSKSDERAV